MSQMHLQSRRIDGMIFPDTLSHMSSEMRHWHIFSDVLIRQTRIRRQDQTQFRLVEKLDAAVSQNEPCLEILFSIIKKWRHKMTKVQKTRTNIFSSCNLTVELSCRIRLKPLQQVQQKWTFYWTSSFLDKSFQFLKL